MAKERTAALKAIRQFLNEANKRISIDKVVLYGSTATGRTHEWSDIDIAVVSDDFLNKTRKERLVLLKEIAWYAKTTEIDALGYTVKEFETDDPLDIVSEIKKNGEVVFDRSAF
jgi:predicted nucleotidyltransferase